MFSGMCGFNVFFLKRRDNKLFDIVVFGGGLFKIPVHKISHCDGVFRKNHITFSMKFVEIYKKLNKLIYLTRWKISSFPLSFPQAGLGKISNFHS